jgi:hypothetical protein
MKLGQMLLTLGGGHLLSGLLASGKHGGNPLGIFGLGLSGMDPFAGSDDDPHSPLGGMRKGGMFGAGGQMGMPGMFPMQKFMGGGQ